MSKLWYIYILTNKRNGIMYVGMTDDIARSAPGFKDGNGSRFAKKYQCTQLVRYKQFPSIDQAIERQETLQGWSRSQKVALIEQINPHRSDLSIRIKTPA